jgi:hypothetical protein
MADVSDVAIGSWTESETHRRWHQESGAGPEVTVSFGE